MNIQQDEQDIDVEFVSSLDHGRLAYIADLTAQLAIMASKAEERRLADMLEAAEREARAGVERIVRGQHF